MTQSATDALIPDALEANRSGVLTDLQRKSLRSSDWAARMNNFVVVPMLVILGIMLVRDTVPARNAWLRPCAGVVALVGADAPAGFRLIRLVVCPDFTPI